MNKIRMLEKGTVVTKTRRAAGSKNPVDEQDQRAAQKFKVICTIFQGHHAIEATAILADST